MPFFIEIFAVFWAKGSKEKEAHDALAHFRLTGVPGTEWFQIEARDACGAVSRAIG